MKLLLDTHTFLFFQRKIAAAKIDREGWQI